MNLVTQQSFVEPVDGVRFRFTTTQDYVPQSVWVFQGSVSILPSAVCEVHPYVVVFVSPNTQQVVSFVNGTGTWESHPCSEGDTLVCCQTTEHCDIGDEYTVHVVDEDTISVMLTPDDEVVTLTGDVFLAAVSPPSPDNGPLWYNCLVAGGSTISLTTPGIWNPEHFIEVFHLQPSAIGFPSSPDSLFLQRVTYALSVASVQIRAYLRSHNRVYYYDDATLPVPVYHDEAAILRYVESLLALKTLIEEPGIFGKGGALAEQIEKFVDGVEITKRFAAYGSQKFISLIKSPVMDILDSVLGWMLPANTSACIYARSHNVLRRPPSTILEAVLEERLQ